MLRNIVRGAARIALPRCSNYQRLAAYSDKVKDENEPSEENDADYWTTDVIPEHPFSRTTRVMGKQMREIKQKMMFWKEPEDVNVDEWEVDSTFFPSHVDIVIVGGGVMGSSIAYWIQKLSNHSFSTVVVEQDPTYCKASTVLSAGGLRQQFSLEENIEMSLYGAEFLRTINEHLSINHKPVDVQFHPYGYLFLATEAGAETLLANSKLQNSMGARNITLTADQLKRRFPWLNTEGIALGCLGLEKEGWFDPWSLLCAFKEKASTMGAQYVTAEAKGFIFRKNLDFIVAGTGHERYQGLNHIVVKNQSGEKKVIQFAICIIAAGANSGRIAEMAQIGKSNGVLSVPLPVEPRKRYVYHFHAPDGPGLNTPMTIDPSGAWLRREGLANHYICGLSPSCDEEEPPTDNLDVDDEYFQNKIWPILAQRVPSFENLKVKSSWAGYYDYNRFDENGIIGHHPKFNNIFFATGFSGHGIQQAPAAGRAIAELIVYSDFKTLDLTRLGFDRFITLEPMQEAHIV